MFLGQEQGRRGSKAGINGSKREIYWKLRLFTEERVCAPPALHPWGFSTPWMLHQDTRQDSSSLGFVWDLDRALPKPKSPSRSCCPHPVLCHSTKTIRTLLNLPGSQKRVRGREKSQLKSGINILVGYPYRIIVTDFICDFSLPLMLQISSKNILVLQ